VLFESPSSGGGSRADWSTASVMARTSELILGGGLDASNVGDAIAAVRPFGVDVSSGVERAPGVKDAQRIREFVVAARIGRQAASA
jgi:phosphoribosylanthranilate isomerase